MNDTFKNYANALTYTSAGAVSSLRLGNGKFENTTFNSRLQPIQIGLGSSATSQNLLKLNFDYGGTDNNGNVKSQTITTPTVGNVAGFTATQIYAYDSLNRLKSAVETIPNQTGWKQTFKFDRYGNRTFDTANNNTTTLANGCPVNICNPTANPQDNKLIGTNYDSNGNTSQDANGQTFVYDAENKQVQVNNASGIVGQYWYNGYGQRVKKYVPSSQETTIFVYDAAGKTVAEYSTIVANQADAKINYTTNDHLGSPRITTDSLGKVISRRDFMPFGEEITRANYGTDSVRQKFTGYERDGETELDFAQARYYNKRIGRFNSADEPFNDQFEDNPQSWSLYSYVRNNPLNLTDPLGMAAGCPPNSPDGCYDRDGKYYHILDGKEYEIIFDSTPMAPVETRIKANDTSNGATLSAILIRKGPKCRTLACEVINDMATQPMILPVPLPAGVTIKSFVGRAFSWLFGKAAPTFANGITRQAILRAANDPGPVVRVMTNLTSAPQSGRGLSVAIGEGGEALAGAARSGGRMYRANIPKALIETLETAGLVTRSTTNMGGVTATELRFAPEATEFITQLFR